MSAASRAPSELDVIRRGRRLVSDLTTPKPMVYWIDFLVSVTVGYVAASVYLASSTVSWIAVASYLLAGFALYRASIFMHEIVHFRRGEMRGFTVAWNILAGIPMMIPSFLYESHIAHHNTQHYGTRNDGEYLPLGIGRLRHLLAFLAQILLLPAFVVFRFLVLVPVSFLHPKLRRWVLEHASSFVINFRHRRDIPPNAPLFWWAMIDVACFLRVAAMFTLVAIGVTEWTRLPKLYSIAMFTLGLNHIRTMVAHRYLSRGKPISHAEQLHDSVNIEGVPVLTELLCPLALRYHALHHLFPSIPYHNLKRAHRRLMENLPSDSAYHAVTFPGFAAAVADLLGNIRKASSLPNLPADEWYRGSEASTGLVGATRHKPTDRAQPFTHPGSGIVEQDSAQDSHPSHSHRAHGQATQEHRSG